MRKPLTAFICIAIFSCSENKSPVSPVADYFSFPLKIGNTWTYTWISTYDSAGVVMQIDTTDYVFRVVDTVRKFQQLFYKVSLVPDSSSFNSSFVGLNSNGDYVSYYDTAQGRLWTNLIMPYHPVIGTAWIDTIAETNAMGGVIRMRPCFYKQILGKYSIPVSAGIFNDCWKVKVAADSVNSPDSVIEYYQSGVGMVKVNYKISSPPFNVTTTKSLKAYTVF